MAEWGRWWIQTWRINQTPGDGQTEMPTAAKQASLNALPEEETHELREHNVAPGTTDLPHQGIPCLHDCLTNL